MFKAARVQKRLGVGVWGHILSWMAKREVRKIFHFCVFIPITEVLKNQEDCPNYLALKDHSILTN